MRVLALLVVAAIASASHAAPAGAETLRRDVRKALDLRTPSEQASALGKAFSGQDSADAAQAAVDLVFDKDEAQIVLDAVVGAVGRMKAVNVVGVLRKGAEAGPALQRLRSIEAMGRSEASGSSGALLALAGDADVSIRAAAVTALGRKEEGVVANVEAALADPAWTVRSAAIGALSRLGVRRSVRPLCDAMRASDGRLVNDCAVALRRITGQRFGADPARYEAWWAKEEKKEIAAPGAWESPTLSFSSPVVGTRSRRLLFVLSTSETMKDAVSGGGDDEEALASVRSAGEDLAADLKAAKTKLDVARVHLRAILRTLRDGVQFDVMTYSGSPAFAFGKLTAADAASRKRAEGRIASLSPGGPANLHGALVRAFDPRGKDPYAVGDGPDTIVLFTDGALAEPGSTDVTEVGSAVVRWNAVRQVKFLAVAVGQADDAVLGRLTSGPPEGGGGHVP